MIVAVSTSSTKLGDLLDAAQKQQVKRASEWGFMSIFIYNPQDGLGNVYLELWGTASNSTSYPIKEDKSISLKEDDLNDISLISDNSKWVIILIGQ